MNNTTDKKELIETPLEDWIDSYDVIRLLRISPRTLLTLRTNGTIPYSKINNKVYFRRQDIQKILADNYVMAAIHFDYGKTIKYPHSLLIFSEANQKHQTISQIHSG